MFTLITINLLIYYFTFLLFFVLLTLYYLPKNFFQMNISQMWSLLDIYLPNSWIFKFLFLQLSGLPPMALFFVKFNFLLMSMNNNTVITQIFIFLNFLLATFFYLKFFSVRGYYINKQNLKLLLEEKTIHVRNLQENKAKLYFFYFIFFTFVALNTLSFLFFFDCFIIFNNLFI